MSLSSENTIQSDFRINYLNSISTYFDSSIKEIHIPLDQSILFVNFLSLFLEFDFKGFYVKKKKKWFVYFS